MIELIHPRKRSAISIEGRTESFVLAKKRSKNLLKEYVA